jgi:mannose-6-phosphate isomerase-like protein (cupin superfamily)
MSSPDGQSSEHEVKAGDFHWVSTKVTHSLANAGSSEGQIVEIELK